MSCCLSHSDTSSKRHSNQYIRSQSWWRLRQMSRQLCFVRSCRSCSFSTSYPCVVLGIGGFMPMLLVCRCPDMAKVSWLLQASMHLDTSFSFCSAAFQQLFKHETPLKRTSSSVATASLIARCQERILLRLEVLTNVIVLWVSVMKRWSGRGSCSTRSSRAWCGSSGASDNQNRSSDSRGLDLHLGIAI